MSPLKGLIYFDPLSHALRRGLKNSARRSGLDSRGSFRLVFPKGVLTHTLEVPVLPNVIPNAASARGIWAWSFPWWLRRKDVVLFACRCPATGMKPETSTPDPSLRSG